MSYAKGTDVPVGKSRAEIIGMLETSGVSEYMVGSTADGPMLVFRYDGIGFKLAVPPVDSSKLATTETGRQRSPEVIAQLVEKERARLWRVLSLTVKAKLVAIAEGLSDFRNEFMADVVVTSTETLRDVMRPRLDALAASGTLALPGKGIE